MIVRSVEIDKDLRIVLIFFCRDPLDCRGGQTRALVTVLRLMELDLSENRQNCLKLQKNCQSQFILTWLQKYNDQRLHKYNKQRNQKCNYYTNAMIKVNIF